MASSSKLLRQDTIPAEDWVWSQQAHVSGKSMPIPPQNEPMLYFPRSNKRADTTPKVRPHLLPSSDIVLHQRDSKTQPHLLKTANNTTNAIEKYVLYISHWHKSEKGLARHSTVIETKTHLGILEISMRIINMILDSIHISNPPTHTPP